MYSQVRLPELIWFLATRPIVVLVAKLWLIRGGYQVEVKLDSFGARMSTCLVYWGCFDEVACRHDGDNEERKEQKYTKGRMRGGFGVALTGTRNCIWRAW